MTTYMEAILGHQKKISDQCRLEQEFMETKQHYDNLHTFLVLVEQGYETVAKEEELSLMNIQVKIMELYLLVLKERAKLLGLEFDA